MTNKKKLILISLSALIICVSGFFLWPKKQKCSNFKLEGKNYCLLVADNQKTREKGLMSYKKPVDFDGMIFIFPEKRLLTFWNYDTHLDLDLYWLEDGRLIGKSYLPSIEKSIQPALAESPRAVNRVIELIRR